MEQSGIRCQTSPSRTVDRVVRSHTEQPSPGRRGQARLFAHSIGVVRQYRERVEVDKGCALTNQGKANLPYFNNACHSDIATTANMVSQFKTSASNSAAAIRKVSTRSTSVSNSSGAMQRTSTTACESCSAMQRRNGNTVPASHCNIQPEPTKPKSNRRKSKHIKNSKRGGTPVKLDTKVDKTARVEAEATKKPEQMPEVGSNGKARQSPGGESMHNVAGTTSTVQEAHVREYTRSQKQSHKSESSTDGDGRRVPSRGDNKDGRMPSGCKIAPETWKDDDLQHRRIADKQSGKTLSDNRRYERRRVSSGCKDSHKIRTAPGDKGDTKKKTSDGIDSLSSRIAPSNQSEVKIRPPGGDKGSSKSPSSEDSKKSHRSNKKSQGGRSSNMNRHAHYVADKAMSTSFEQLWLSENWETELQEETCKKDSEDIARHIAMISISDNITPKQEPMCDKLEQSSMETKIQQKSMDDRLDQECEVCDQNILRKNGSEELSDSYSQGKYNQVDRKVFEDEDMEDWDLELQFSLSEQAKEEENVGNITDHRQYTAKVQEKLKNTTVDRVWVGQTDSVVSDREEDFNQDISALLSGADQRGPVVRDREEDFNQDTFALQSGVDQRGSVVSDREEDFNQDTFALQSGADQRGPVVSDRWNDTDRDTNAHSPRVEKVDPVVGDREEDSNRGTAIQRSGVDQRGPEGSDRGEDCNRDTYAHKSGVGQICSVVNDREEDSSRDTNAHRSGVDRRGPVVNDREEDSNRDTYAHKSEVDQRDSVVNDREEDSNRDTNAHKPGVEQGDPIVGDRRNDTERNTSSAMEHFIEKRKTYLDSRWSPEFDSDREIGGMPFGTEDEMDNSWNNGPQIFMNREYQYRASTLLDGQDNNSYDGDIDDLDLVEGQRDFAESHNKSKSSSSVHNKGNNKSKLQRSKSDGNHGIGKHGEPQRPRSNSSGSRSNLQLTLHLDKRQICNMCPQQPEYENTANSVQTENIGQEYPIEEYGMASDSEDYDVGVKSDIVEEIDAMEHSNIMYNGWCYPNPMFMSYYYSYAGRYPVPFAGGMPHRWPGQGRGIYMYRNPPGGIPGQVSVADRDDPNLMGQYRDRSADQDCDGM